MNLNYYVNESQLMSAPNDTKIIRWCITDCWNSSFTKKPLEINCLCFARTLSGSFLMFSAKTDIGHSSHHTKPNVYCFSSNASFRIFLKSRQKSPRLFSRKVLNSAFSTLWQCGRGRNSVCKHRILMRATLNIWLKGTEQREKLLKFFLEREGKSRF